jgi:hypothetical protein
MTEAALQRRQSGQLLRLRAVRLEVAQRDLAEARALRAAADRALAEADLRAAGADKALAVARQELAADPAEAERRLAILDRSLFDQSVARSAAIDAAEMLAEREEQQRARLHAMVLAEARHDVLAKRAEALARAARRRRDDLAEAETQDARRMR